MGLKLVILGATLAAAPLAQAQTAAPTHTAPVPVAQIAPAAPAAAQPATPLAPSSAAPAQAVPPTPPPAPPPPPPPPPPPTDPAAIAVLATVENVCIPAVQGGDLARIAKANGFRKNDAGFNRSGAGYRLNILPPGSNPTQCHIDMTTPVTPEGPAAPIVVALHNWAAVENGWSLYRNDKSVEGDQQLTTRSWEHDDPGKHEAMFITTYRRADGSPMKGAADTSTLVYSETKTGE